MRFNAPHNLAMAPPRVLRKGRFREGPSGRQRLIAAALLAAAPLTGCTQDRITSPDLPPTSPSIAATVTARVVLSADTLYLGPPGMQGTLSARLYDLTGAEITGTAKWWTSTTTPADLTPRLCAFPCTVTVTSKAVGTVKVITYWYGGPATALRDTAWIVVRSTPPTDSTSSPPPPRPDPLPPSASLGPAVSSLPVSGLAWSRLQAMADQPWAAPNVCDQNNKADVQALAGALVYARTGTESYKLKVMKAISAMMLTQRDGCSNAALALGRQLGGWVMAADYIGYRDPAFIGWLTQVRTREIGGHGRWHQLRFTSGNSSNNWGIWALASLIAADRFLGDSAAVERDWAIFKGYGDGTWTFQPTSGYLAGWNCGAYRAIEGLHCGNPDRNGAPVEDASRSGSISAPDGGYVMEALSGYTVQAMLLAGAGYDAWGVNDQQVKRVADFQTRYGIFNYHPVGYFVAWVLNRVYGASYPALPGNGGRMLAFTDWLFGS